MKKLFRSCLSATALLLLCGCTAPPEPVAEPAPAPLTCLEQLRAQATDLREAGVPAVVGVGESRHLELAVKRARAEGRRKLSRLLIQRIQSLEEELLSAPDTVDAGAVRGAFDLAADALTGPDITALAQQRIEHESGDVQFSVYALTVLDPGLFAERLAARPNLADPLRSAGLLSNPPRGAEAFAAYQNTAAAAPRTDEPDDGEPQPAAATE